MQEGKILVVDDEEPIRTQFTRGLAQAGYSVRAVESGEQALQAMREEPAQVIFLDLNLPGANGLEVCRAIRKTWPWAVVIAVTGYASMFELVDCREAGFEDYFLKPVSLSDLLEAAETAFKKIRRWRER